MNLFELNPDTIRDNQNAAAYKKFLLKIQIIEIFYKEGHKSIADLCEATNNSIPSMTSVINELIEDGWVKNYGIGPSKGGRKPSIYGLNPVAGYIVGIDLSRKYTRICIYNLLNQNVGQMLELEQGLDTSDDILDILKDEADNLLKSNKIQLEQVIGFGIAIPGLIDIKKGVSYSYPQLGSGNLNQTFKELFGRPAFVEHDTKAMVLGEAWFGQAIDMTDVLLINIGSGIGMASILNGKIFRGHSGFSGEFGHIQAIPDGELCYCGKIGCLETIASGSALIRIATEKISAGKSSAILKLAHNNIKEIKTSTIIKAAESGDQFAIELLEEAGEYLARGISTLIHLYNPQAIIIGGELADAGHLILDPIQQKINKYTMLRLRLETRLIISELKEKAGLMGTIPTVMANIFNQPFESNQKNEFESEY